MNEMQISLFDLMDAKPAPVPSAARPVVMQAHAQMYGEKGYYLYGTGVRAVLDVPALALDATFMFEHFRDLTRYYIGKQLADPRETVEVMIDYIADKEDEGSDDAQMFWNGTWINRRKGEPPARVCRLPVSALYDYAAEHPDALKKERRCEII